MTEDAFERFRQLRGIAQPVTAPVQPQQTAVAIEEESWTPLTLLLSLHALGVILTPWPDGTVRCRAPTGVLTPALHATLRQHQQALLDLLEAFEERAAIAEYCGGLAREDAERLAWDCLVQEESSQASGSCGACKE